MSQLKALVSGLVQNPRLLESLIKNPQDFPRLAGVNEADRQKLTQVAKAALNALKRPANSVATPVKAGAVVASRSPGMARRMDAGTAITGIVALTAVVGSVVVLSTVSVVALSGE